MYMNVKILGGKNGTGKGSLLAEAVGVDNFVVVSVGNYLREAVKNGTELGKLAKAYMDSGALVPDSVIIDLVLEAIDSTDKSVVLDGFPRTIPQAEAMLNAGITPSVVILLEVDDSELVQRAIDRVVCKDCGAPYTLNDFNPPRVPGVCNVCSGPLHKRKDDDPAVVRERLAVFAEQTAPVFPFLAAAGIPVHTINNSNSRPKGEALKEFEELLAF